jgi:twinkle protein
MVERKGDVLIGDDWDELGLDIPRNKLSSGSDIKIKNCPECSKMGKKNDFSISIIPAAGKGHCWKCGTKFILRNATAMGQDKKEKTYTPPSKANITAITDRGVQYFTNRRISQAAINHFKIAERNGSVAFPYIFNGETVNIKYKQISEKRYMQSPGGMHVVFNYDGAKTYNAVIVTEGEEECMCWFDAGFPYAVSVDSGAPNPSDKIDKKLECITNSFDLFENADVIYIAVDEDENGRRLQAELIRRFDTEKVKLISFGPHKDANDYLLYEGVDKLALLPGEAKDIRMDGVIYIDSVKERLWDMYRNGLPKGTTTHMPSIDQVWKWREGEVTLVSGYANEGKSSLFNINLPILKAKYEGWKFGLFIPENLPPELFFEDVMSAYIGKTSDIDHAQFRMSEKEYEEAMDFVGKHFFIVNLEEEATLENIFKRMDYLVRKEGIRVIVIDPYNMVEQMFKPGQTYDLHVSSFMTSLTKFAQKRRISAILVAHQNKPEKKTADGNYPEPEAYNTKGGGTFFDKTHNYVSVWRPYRFSDKDNPLVAVTSTKIKMKKLVANTGSVDIFFDWKSNRYQDSLLGMKHPFDMHKPTKEAAPRAMEEVSDTYDGADELPF